MDRVAVTVTPAGTVTDVTVGGHSIAGVIRNDAVELVIFGTGAPRLTLILEPDEITVRESAGG